LINFGLVLAVTFKAYFHNAAIGKVQNWIFLIFFNGYELIRILSNFHLIFKRVFNKQFLNQNKRLCSVGKLPEWLFRSFVFILVIFWANFICANLFFFSILSLTYTFISPEFSRRKLKILNILILLLGLWVSIFGLKIFLLSLTIFINFTFIILFVSMLILQKNCFSCLYFWV
jgi:hypothetical protein